jgi:dynactin complex subunit
VPSTLAYLPLSPRGATLDIGIPCIISSKRKRFKAFARYIGEVEGEAGPWVGVEVPAAAADGIGAGARQWHDGSWGGVRYFEIGPGGAGSEWEYGDEGRERAARRRRLEGSGYGFGGTQKGVKREGDSTLGGARGAKRIRSASPAVSDADGAGESRGLFVRPSAVLYVVDAVGADL